MKVVDIHVKRVFGRRVAVKPIPVDINSPVCADLGWCEAKITLL